MAFTMKVSEIVASDTSGLLGKHHSWERVQLSEVAAILNGAPFDSSQFNPTHGLPLVRIRDLVVGSSSTYYAGPYDDQYLVQSGDLLVGMDGDFKSAFWRSNAALLNQRVCKVSTQRQYFDHRFLGYVLPAYLSAINANTPSITVKHLSSKTIGEIPLPLPPLAEQRRIANKLDELLSDLDAGMEELKTAERTLVKYRHALLNSAADGTISTARRTTGASSPDSGQLFLQRILVDRRRQWEANQSARFAAQGQVPSPNWQAKYRAPLPPSTSELPPLPDGWVWASLDQLAWSVRNGLSTKPADANSGNPILRINAVRAMSVDLNEVRFLPEDAGNLSDYLLDDGDLLATRYNGSQELVGAVGVVRGLTRGTVYPDKLIRLRLAFAGSLGPWVEICAATGASRRHVMNRLKTTAGQTGIAGEDMKKMPIPLPPEREMVELSERLHSSLDGVRRLFDTAAPLMNLCTAQRRNLLRVAFSGQLVPQDPADEPASDLLARIRAEGAGRVASKPLQAKRVPRARKSSLPTS